MSDDFTPKPGTVRVGGLGPKAQKLQALRDKAAAATDKAAGKPAHTNANANFKNKDAFAGSKKTSFQRKSV